MLANNVFKHQITLDDKKVLLITAYTLYIFNLSFDTLYNNIEFKKLFIDSEV